MSDSNSSSSSGGIGLAGALAVLFIALKLTGVIAWSWWWVLSPLWIPFCAALAIMAVIGIVFLIRRILFASERRKR